MRDLKLLKALKFFLKNPYTEVYLRELAKKLALSPYATKKYVDLLVEQGLIKEERKANLRYFKANTNNLFFKHLKISFSINIILQSGLVEFLTEQIPNASSIVLFGSMAKGEDDEESDADILVIGKEKNLDLSKMEEKIGKEINLHIFSWSKWNKKSRQDEPFYYEIVGYGIVLHGEMPLVKWK